MRVTPPIVVIHHDVFPTVPFLSTGDISLNWNRTPATAIETAFISFGLILTGMAVGLVVDYSDSAVEAVVEMQHMTTSMAKELASAPPPPSDPPSTPPALVVAVGAV